MPKCRYCKKEIEKEQCYKVGKASYFCDELCYKKSKEKNNKIDNKKIALTDYIQKIYIDNCYEKKDILWATIMSQLKNIMKDNADMTYSGIKYCLYYMYEICEDDLFSKMNCSILDLVPYKYKEAKAFFNKKKNISIKVKEDYKNAEIQEIVVKDKSISYDNFDDIE